MKTNSIFITMLMVLFGTAAQVEAAAPAMNGRPDNIVMDRGGPGRGDPGRGGPGRGGPDRGYPGHGGPDRGGPGHGGPRPGPYPGPHPGPYPGPRPGPYPGPGYPGPRPGPVYPGPRPANLCSGVYSGSYLGLAYGDVTFALNLDRFGGMQVTSYYRGAAYNGNGSCRQNGPWQADLEMYFPGGAVHRATISIENNYAVMRGREEGGGYSFVLSRPL